MSVLQQVLCMDCRVTLTDLAGKTLSSECIHLEGDFVVASVFSNLDIERIGKGEELSFYIGDMLCKVKKSK